MDLGIPQRRRRRNSCCRFARMSKVMRQREQRQLQPPADSDLVIYVGEVALYGEIADSKPLRYFLIACPTHDVADDLKFARAKIEVVRVRCRNTHRLGQ